MCLAVPLKVESIEGKNAVCEFNGVRRKVHIDFVPNVKVDEFVLVHAGFAIEIIDKKSAEESRQAFMDVMEHAEG